MQHIKERAYSKRWVPRTFVRRPHCRQNVGGAQSTACRRSQDRLAGNIANRILENMVTQMKRTIEIADNLLNRAKARAREQRNGLSRDLEDASWEKIRDTFYR